jgi:hypothetical protein
VPFDAGKFTQKTGPGEIRSGKNKDYPVVLIALFGILFGAGSGNRTRTKSLEGFCDTISPCPHLSQGNPRSCVLSQAGYRPNP